MAATSETPEASTPGSEGSPSSPSEAPPAAAQPSPPTSSSGEKLRGWRRWVFPLLTVVAVPLLLLGGLELALRLGGYGVVPDFWRTVEVKDRETSEVEAFWTPNPRFGWRFFPPAIARSPVISRVAREPEGDRLRVVVLGGSAALGTPDAAFGFGRQLEVMLAETWPEREVEVVIAALTAVNSHVVLAIAEESLQRLEPDALAVYLGNNEVVGPWGPGTVFAGFSDSLSAIRWSLWLSSTRTGQLVRNLAGGGEDAPSEWLGLELFEERKLAPDDPRLETVYDHLEANLRDLAAAARDAGVPVLLSTVAVNLTDSPPFASVHRSGLGEEELSRWREAFDRGVERLEGAQGTEDVREALAALQEAEEIDGGYADLHFYLAHAHKLLQEPEEAARRWRRARDTDALRFRADSRINETIRRVAETEEGVELIDGEAAVAGDDGPPGNEVLWEHVHLNPEGNYRLAEAFFRGVAALPGAANGEAPQPPPRQRVGERLALSPWNRYRMVDDVLAMTSRPPFTGQLGHRQVLRQRRLLAAELRLEVLAERDASAELYRRALETRPDDLPLRANYASLLQDSGRLQESVAQWDELLDRLPGVLPWRTERAFALADQARRDAAREARTGGSEGSGTGEPAGSEPAGEEPIDSEPMNEAVAEMEAVRDARPESPEAWVNLGSVLDRARRDDRAEQVYRETLERFPSYRPALFNLGTLLADQGDLDAAEALYREALEPLGEEDGDGSREAPDAAELHGRLGEVLERKEDFEGALAEYRAALELEPDLAPVRNNLGFLLERQGKLNEAAEAYRRALESDPSYPLPYFNLGDLLLQGGRAEQAAAAYNAGLSLAPFNLQARYNFGTALAAAGRQAEAAETFRRLLQVAPGHPGALNNLAWLLANSESDELRDPEEAVRLAEQAVARIPDPRLLETLARAYAAAGRRGEAHEAANRALEAARRSGEEGLVEALTERLRDLL